MPCHHTSKGEVPLDDASCSLAPCPQTVAPEQHQPGAPWGDNNATCCQANNTEFSAMEGMRCGAGHKNGTLPWDSSEDPG